MLIIEKEDLDVYRYSVAKIVFLKVYQDEYRLIENIHDSNCFIVKSIDGRKLLISIFGQPNIKERSLRKENVNRKSKSIFWGSGNRFPHPRARRVERDGRSRREGARL